MSLNTAATHAKPTQSAEEPSLWSNSSSGAAEPPPQAGDRIEFERVTTLDVPGGAGRLSVGDGRAAVITGGHGVRLVDLSDVEQPRLGQGLQLADRPRNVELTARHLFATAGHQFYAMEAADGLRPVSSLLLKSSFPRGFAVQGDFVFLADGLPGLQVISVAEARRPRFVTTVEPSDPPGAFESVKIEDGLAYVGGAVNGKAGLEIFDVEDPLRPSTLGSSAVAGNSVPDLELVGHLLLVAAGNGGLSIYDATEPRHVELISHHDSLALQAVTAEGDRAFLADRVEGLIVLDISDPANPRRIGEYRPAARDENSSVADVAVLGEDLLLVSLGNSGVQILRWSEAD